MDYLEWFPERLTQLRKEKGVSARDMSLSLGQSETYINKIENRRTMPSMSGFFYICEYFGIEPKDFFDTRMESPKNIAKITEAVGRLDAKQVEHILQIIMDMTDK